MHLKINQKMGIVFFGKAIDKMLFVLPNTLNQVTGDTNV